MGNAHSRRVLDKSLPSGGRSQLLESLKTSVPANIVSKVRSAFLFRPDDGFDLQQTHPARMTVKGVDRIKGYRYPAPGSRGPVSIPVEPEEDSHKQNFYARDSRSVPVPELVMTQPRYAKGKVAPGELEVRVVLPEGLVIDPEKGDVGKYIVDPENKSSPGVPNPDALRWDPSGLSFTMMATWKEMYNSIEAKAKPNHLPTPAWLKDEDEIIAEYERKGLPMPPGREYGGWKRSKRALTKVW